MQQQLTTRTESLINDLLESSVFDRIKRISFLGIIDHFNAEHSSNSTKGFSRAEHSLGVLKIGLLVAKKINLDDNETSLLSAACILHDIGHPPMSHSLEHAFSNKLGSLNHHKVLKEILFEKGYKNSEIQNILKKHGITPKQVHDILDFNSSSKLKFLFFSPINIDTIDGISRFFWSFGFKTPYDLNMLVDFIAEIYSDKSFDTCEYVDNADLFWKQKEAFYNSFLQNSIYSKVELSFQETAVKHINKLSYSHYFLEELDLLKLHTELNPNRNKIKATQKKKPKDRFEINRNIEVINKNNIEKRYVRNKYANH